MGEPLLGCLGVSPFPYLAGWLVFMVAFFVAQTRFLDAHQRVHGEWRARSTFDRLFGVYRLREYDAMLRATFRRDEDPVVERARRLFLVIFAAGIAYLVALVFFFARAAV
jgi:hypothetical protein